MTLINRIARRFLPQLQSADSHVSSIDEVAHVVSAESLARLERNLLRHQISVKWDVIHRLEALKPPRSDVDCALCGERHRRDELAIFDSNCIFEGGAIRRFQCPSCDVIFGSEVMLAFDAAALTKEYEWHYQVFEEGDSTEQEVRAFHALKPNKDAIYINWGAGSWSSSVRQLRAEGWQVFGYEPHASARINDDAMLGSLSEVVALGPQGIFSNNLLEHFRDPVAELKQMSAVLPSGSLMSHATPCFEYCFEFTRFHLFFFLGRSKYLIASEAGLDVEEYVEEGNFRNLVLRKP